MHKKFGVVKNAFCGVSGYLGSVLTISDQNRVLWGVFFEKKVPPRILPPIQILPNSKVIEFGFVPYLEEVCTSVYGF